VNYQQIFHIPISEWEIEAIRFDGILIFELATVSIQIQIATESDRQ
jgi:hypothetical protein